MAWMKRITLFIAVNFLVMTTLSILLRLFNVQPYLTAQGIDYKSLMAFCLIWGMGGALISLAMSRMMAKWLMGVRLVDGSEGAEEQWLVGMVHRLAEQAGLPKMPQVGVYASPELNAFATGPTKARALVAVSSGLLQKMDRNEVEGVLGHEITHVANGDMVTMTLIQGIVNAFVLFLSRVLAFALSQALRERDSRRGSFVSYYMIQFLLEVVFMFLGMMVVAWFSRYREYRADAGGAGLAGRQKMVRALQALQRNYGLVEAAAAPKSQAAVAMLKISSRRSGFLKLFSTHPPLEERIARLSNAAY